MANHFNYIVLLCATFYVVLAKHEAYDGHSLYQVVVKDAAQTKYINELKRQIPIDVFSNASPEEPGHILVSKDLKRQFESLLTAKEVEYEIQVENIREHLMLEDELLAAAAARSHRSETSSGRSVPALNYNEIHRYEVVDDYLARLGEAYPDTVKVESAGTSFEGRDMKYLKISTTNFEDTRKPVVFLMSLLNAREWVSLPTTLYAIDKLVLNITDNDLVENFDWIILPIANPDGFEFTHTIFRFWSKNRATGFSPNDDCLGVDLNSNFEVLWGTASSNDPCSENFHGTGPFSEPETQNIKRIIDEHSYRIALFVDLRSFGSQVVFGFGNGQFPPNALILNLNAVNMARAIDNVKRDDMPNYVVGNSYHVVRPSSGGSSDYVQALGVPLSYTFKLPAFGGFSIPLIGFFVEPSFIRQAGMETWEGIKVGARFALQQSVARRQNYLFKRL